MQIELLAQNIVRELVTSGAPIQLQERIDLLQGWLQKGRL